MNTFFLMEKGSRLSSVVENAKQKSRDECQLRLARIANGADPGEIGGCGEDKKKKKRAKHCY